MQKNLFQQKTLSKVNIGIFEGRGNLPLLSKVNKTNYKIKIHNKQ